MTETITIAYITNRRECKIEWWWDSLILQGGDKYPVIVVDFFHSERDTTQGIWKTISEKTKHVPPMPNVWSGPHRLTKQNWFSASAFRNTSLCYCETSHLAYCDDLSIVAPTWLEAAEMAVKEGYIALGAYQKVKGTTYDNGDVQYTSFPRGIDSRWEYGSDNGPVPASGGMLYGCSIVIPVEALLIVNGWPSDLCDSLGSEDYCCGLALQNAGYTFKYDRKLFTLESEELHHVGEVFRKEDWHFENGVAVPGGNGGEDKSHAALNIAKASKYFPNSFGEGGIREIRRRVLAGEPFPIPKTPDRDWYSKIPLSEL